MLKMLDDVITVVGVVSSGRSDEWHVAMELLVVLISDCGNGDSVCFHSAGHFFSFIQGFISGNVPDKLSDIKWQNIRQRRRHDNEKLREGGSSLEFCSLSELVFSHKQCSEISHDYALSIQYSRFHIRVVLGPGIGKHRVSNMHKIRVRLAQVRLCSHGCCGIVGDESDSSDSRIFVRTSSSDSGAVLECSDNGVLSLRQLGLSHSHRLFNNNENIEPQVLKVGPARDIRGCGSPWKERWYWKCALMKAYPLCKPLEELARKCSFCEFTLTVSGESEAYKSNW